MGGTFKVVAGTGGHLFHEHFFGNAATKQHADLVQHEVFVVAVAVFFWQAHGDTKGAATRDDGDLVHRVALGQQLADERVTGFVVGGVAALFFGHDHALALGAHENFVFGFFKVLHFHHAGIAACGHQGGLVAQVGQVGTAHAGGATGNHCRVHILAQRHFAHVHVQNLFAATDVWQRYVHLAVKPARAQQGGVQDVGAVGGGHHNHAQVGLKTVHLNQHLVQGLFTLVIATTQACAPLATHGVNLVDEDDARRVLFGVLKHVAHTGRTYADKHFHKVGTADAKKRYLGFTGNAFGQQSFAGAGRAHQQQAARNAPAEFLELGRVL